MTHDELVAENTSLRRAIAAMNLTMWHQTQDRFAHGFDAIRNDCCPACGGPVVVDDVGRGLILRATRE